MDVTGIFHEDIDEPGAAVSSFAIPQPRTRRATLHIEKEIGALGIELGGIWGGDPLVGRKFQVIDEEMGVDSPIYQDEIRPEDTWGGKAKITFASGPIKWYAQGAAIDRILTQFSGRAPDLALAWKNKYGEKVEEN